MKLIVLLIALALERFVHVGNNIVRFHWINGYLDLIRNPLKKMNVHQGLVGAIAAALPAVIVVGIVYSIFSGFLFNLFGFVLAIAILVYCLGPRDLYTDLEKYFVAKTQENEKAINDSLDNLGVESISEDETEERAVTKSIFSLFNTRIFAVMFWFVLLGPLGALFYRMVERIQVVTDNSKHADHALAAGAKTIQDFLEWAPIRLAGLGYALVGDFQHGFAFWMKNVFTGVNQNQEIVEQSGLVALHLTESNAKKADIKENKSALTMVEHTLILYLVVVALFTLGSWIY